AYDRLAQMTDVRVEGIPASLIARVGRASLFEEIHRTADLRREATALDQDLRNGRWQLLQSEYAFHSGQAREWLGASQRPDDSEMVARAESAAWLWQNRGSGPGFSRRLLQAAGKSILLIWNTSAGRLHAIIAGPEYLASL